MIGGIVRCLATVSMGGTLREKLQASAAAGFEAVELFEPDLLGSGETPRCVRRMAADLGVRIDVFGPLRDIEGLDDGEAGAQRGRAERMLDVAIELGATMLLVCSNTSPQAIDDCGRSAAQLAELADRAAERDVRVGFEALSWGTHIRTYGAAWNVVRLAGHASLGLVLDTFHTSALGDDPAAVERIPAASIFLVQVADAPRLDCEIVFLSRHLRCFPGEGAFPVEQMLRHVLATGYAGPMSLEIFSDRLRAAPALPTAREAMRSWLALERAMTEPKLVVGT